MTNTLFRATTRRASLLLFLAAAVLAALVVPAPGAQADHPPRPRDKYIGYTVELAVVRDGELKMLSISMVVSGDGTATAEQSREEAEELLLTRFPGAVIVEEGEIAAQNVLKSYHWTSGQAPFTYNAAGKPAALEGDLNAIIAAADTWSTAGAAFRFVFQGTTTKETGACRSDSTLDSQNTVGWVGDLPEHILGIACSWYGTSGAVEFDVEFNNTFRWTTSASEVDIDFQTIAAHELGHALGLGNTQQTFCPDDDAASRSLMCGYYLPGTLIRHLSEDEISGLLMIYGPLIGVLPRPETPFRVVIPDIGRN